jgi:uncharacterized repeat protein (TIGR03803 family)
MPGTNPRTTEILAIATLATGLALIPPLAHAQTLTTLYAFQGGTDGGRPFTPVTYHNGVLYGTTLGFSNNTGNGTVFKLDPTTGAETVLHSFSGGADGVAPSAGVTYHGGSLYGTTAEGGAHGGGIVFKVDAATGHEIVLYSFTGGANPEAGVVYQAGTLYGTTEGILYALNPATRVETVLYTFPSGDNPGDASVIYQNGVLYGTTYDQTDGGTVYAVNASTGAATVLHTFTGEPDGSAPFTGLVYQGGTLYGTTFGGGRTGCRGGCGTAFSVNPATGAESVLYDFKRTKNRAQGYEPRPSALLYHAGALYGATTGGGASDSGTLFKINLATGRETVLYSFTGGTDGASPYAGLIYQGGAFYGTTSGGGDANCGCGTVFKFVP